MVEETLWEGEATGELDDTLEALSDAQDNSGHKGIVVLQDMHALQGDNLSMLPHDGAVLALENLDAETREALIRVCKTRKLVGLMGIGGAVAVRERHYINLASVVYLSLVLVHYRD